MKAKPKSIKLDSSDLKILSALRANGRETLTKISRDTGIPISLVFDRLKRMEEGHHQKIFLLGGLETARAQEAGAFAYQAA